MMYTCKEEDFNIKWLDLVNCIIPNDIYISDVISGINSTYQEDSTWLVEVNKMIGMKVPGYHYLPYVDQELYDYMMSKLEEVKGCLLRES